MVRYLAGPITLGAFACCVYFTLELYDDPTSELKVKVAYILLSLMIWSSIFTFLMNLFGWNKSGQKQSRDEL
jgi:hypothetical protein